jgi:hypothetical protein
MSSASKPSKNVEKTDAAFQAIVDKVDRLSDRLRAQQDDNAELKRQLDWFKRQLFGRKSEKRLIESAEQGDRTGAYDVPSHYADVVGRPAKPALVMMENLRQALLVV